MSQNKLPQKRKNKPYPDKIQSVDEYIDQAASSPEFLNKLHDSANKQQLVSISRAMIHFGPLPDPDTLKRYEATIKGSANWMIARAEKEQSHRHKFDLIKERNQLILKLLGQTFGLTSVILIIWFAVMLTASHPVAAATMVTGTVASLAYVFVMGRKHDAQPPKQKSGEQSQPPDKTDND
ncbi:MAG: DUF2335 domain-containing protein [Enterobacteriaceae bacterium]